MEVRTIPPRLNRHKRITPPAPRTRVLPSAIEKKPVAEIAAPVITKIEALPRTEKKLRVAGYCRVSTGSINQETSLLNQREHYENYIRANSEWEFVGIYWEADVSGTKADNRPELQRLIADCKAGRVNMILTKSISRFARNTTDCLEMVRTLTSLGVSIRFEKENINTGTMESEFLLTVYSSFAEEESKSISLNETWAKRNQFQNGTFRFSFAPFGYLLVEGGFVINPEQAPIVREIFNAVLDGKGTSMIAKELNARSVPTGTRKNDGSPGVWTSSMINGMIKNVVYLGDILHQKTFVDNFQVKYNYGERQQYYNEGHHEALVDRETFELANAALRQRGREKGNVLRENRQLRDNPHNNRYAFSGKLTCACCGGSLKRVTQKTSQGMRYHWACSTHIEERERCSMKREQEETIRNAFSTMLNKLVFSHLPERYEDWLRAESPDTKPLEEELKRILEEKHRLSLLLSKGCGEPVSYIQKTIELEAKENEVRAQMRDDRFMPMGELEKALNAWKKGAEPDDIFGTICDGAVVKAGEYVEFHLRCGLMLTEPTENK